jgi:hypothetical protein
LTIPSADMATTTPKTAPAIVISSPSRRTSTRIDRGGMPIKRRMPMISRRSSARMIISASRKAVLPVTVTMAIAQ